jgi:hypothetical protein
VSQRRLTAQEILDAIRRWHHAYGEPPSMSDWDPYRAGLAGQSWRIVRYRAGDWPSVKSVRNHFGRLSDAVAAAGLVPRHQGQQRPREEASLDERTLLHIAHLRALRSGVPPADGLATALREVARARSSADPDDLHVALVAVAAAALVWAKAVVPDETPTAARAA